MKDSLPYILPISSSFMPHLSLKAGQRHISINLLWIIKFPWVSVRYKVKDIRPSQAHLVYRWGLMFLKGCYKINSSQKSGLLKWMTAHWFARSASQISHTVKHNTLRTAVCLLSVLIIYTVFRDDSKWVAPSYRVDSPSRHLELI